MRSSEETKTFMIGSYALRRLLDGKIWIETEDGEGGSFSEADIEKALETFYNKYF